MQEKRDQWSSKLGFIFAAAGSAVGLGNIWKFPGKAYAGGGGVFLVTYILVVIFIGVPVQATELSLGRHCQANTVGIFRKLDKRFTWVGWFGTLCAFIIFGYYAHVGGYVMRYIFSYIFEPQAVMDGGLNYFLNLLGYDAATGATWFPWTAVIFAAISMALNAFILIKGVSGGIEKFNKYAMPALFVILFILLARAVTLDGSAAGLKYMLSFDFSKASGEMFVVALGQAFYSLSLGMAIMTTYGSYLSREENIGKNVGIICSLDTLVAVTAGFMVVPAVFATAGDGSGIGKGASFGFGALSAVFKAMPAGAFFGVLFYLLLFFAALSSCISIGEGVTSFICEEFHTERKKTIIWLCVVCFILGTIYTISQAAYSIKLPWIDFTGINMMGAGDWMETVTDRLLLPVCALGECIFVGWIWKPQNVIDEMRVSGAPVKFAGLYSFLIRFVCPAAILAILLISFITGTTIS